jgi:DNA damage-binding protein 1
MSKELKKPILNPTNQYSLNSYQSTDDLTKCLNKAFREKNIELSKTLHDNKKMEEYHKQYGSDFIKSLIFGGLDGIVTSFSIIASCHSSNLDNKYVIIVGIANIIAGAISMGHGDYFSEKTELDYIKDQYDREKWEMTNYPEGELEEMLELYVEKHKISEEDAKTILLTMVKYKSFFIDHMMMIELDLLPPDENANPIKNGIITFFSFICFGSIPVITYIIWMNFFISLLFSFLTLGGLGYIKSKFIKSNKLYIIFNTILNGSLSAGLAYIVGFGLDKLLS